MRCRLHRALAALLAIAAISAISAIAAVSAIAACSASGAVDDSRRDGGALREEAGLTEAGPPEDAGPGLDLDAERPLACGDAGFCETRVPSSDLGVPLSFRGVWVAGANDVWSVTAEGWVLHHDGTSWTVEHRVNHELYAVWATPTSVWAGGEAGLLFHRNAAGEWSRVEPGHAAPIRSIYGTSDSDVWFTRDGSALDHFDGKTISKRPVDVPGLRITTVFGRIDVGTYALGHVLGQRGDAGTMLDEPHAFELADGGIAPFNPALPETRGFVPLAGFVTTSVDPDRRIFMAGYVRARADGGPDRFHFAHVLFGGASAVTIVAPSEPGVLNPPQAGNVSHHVVDMILPGLNYKASDIRLPLHMWQVLRWNGQGLTSASLAMGRELPPARIFGAHAGATESWIVGEGFALKGANP